MTMDRKREEFPTLASGIHLLQPYWTAILTIL